jgi:hypothetical protein
MDIGMLWMVTNLKLTFEQRLAEASAFYEAKWKVRPNAAHVNPGQLPEGVTSLNGIALVARKFIIINYIWIGVESETLKEKAA